MKRLFMAASLLALTAGWPKPATRSASSDRPRSILSPPLSPNNLADRPAKTPVVESTGTGGGMKLFCAGVGGGPSGRHQRVAPDQEVRI